MKEHPGTGALATDHAAGRDGHAPEPSAAAGFAVRLEGATIHDLVQMECCQRAPKIVRVRAGGRTGMLYFREGQVVHATVANEVGEAAFREILSWPGGTFETWQAPWPATESIGLAWQHLLLRAAAADDERRRGSKVLSFPGAAESIATAPIAAAPPGDVAIRLGADGRILDGKAAPQLAEAVAYAAQLADRIGELLGLEPFTRMDLALSNQTACLIRRQSNGDLVALKAAGPSDAMDNLAAPRGA